MRRDLLRGFADIAIDSGVQICIENMPNWECFLFRYPDIDLDGTDLALDVGHANTTGTLNEFIKYDIGHFHLHDNHGEKWGLSEDAPVKTVIFTFNSNFITFTMLYLGVY
ncbi:MAG: hypothetical protein L6282_17020 [Candidatus Methanoperedenaceae archaeon]|nr:hypothetical protein [Candidatus Methanoperedenaceae archaeon]